MARPPNRNKLVVYNSLTGHKDPFEPVNPDCVKWYSCGPTVYDLAHLGHARSYLAFDIMRRLLEDYFGYNVLYVMNITDIDDKIIKRARSWYLFHEWVREHIEAYNSGGLNTKRISATIENATSNLISVLETVNDKAKKGMLEGVLNKSKSATEQLGQFFVTSEGATDNQKQLEEILEKFRDLIADSLDKQSGHTITDLAIFKRLAEFYEREFHSDMAKLNIKPPSVITRVSDYIDETVDYIKRIEDNGYAYRANGSVYFDTEKFRSHTDVSGKQLFTYPKLRPDAFGHRDCLDEGEGELSSAGNEKISQNNFALWKNSKQGEPRWPTAFGEGRPGWHIECSVMAHATLGESLDIHSGGEDLKFPHHDNEIAQADAHYNTGKDWVRYFLHSGHLTISGCKMSKSLKNFITIRDALQQHTARQLRLLFLLHGWNDQLDYSPDTMKESLSFEKTFTEFFLNTIDKLRCENSRTEPRKWKPSDDGLINELANLRVKVDESFCDSFNTRLALISFRESIGKCNKQMDDCHPGPVLKIALFVQNILVLLGCDYSATKLESHIDVVSAGNELAFGGDDKFATQVAYVLADFRGKIREQCKKQSPPCDCKLSVAQLKLCDELRDQILPEVGIRFEDKEINGESHTAVKIIDRETALREREQLRQAKLERERMKELKEHAKAEKKQQQQSDAKNLLSPSEMFRSQTDRFSRFDDNGLPTHDFEGKKISDSQRKKLLRLYKEREKKFQKH
ncbi:Cysteine--tRNA ligase, cytoplasmic, partial [Fragariocoptes setiger]